MNKTRIILLVCFFQLLVSVTNSISAQENLRPLRSNLGYLYNTTEESRYTQSNIKNKQQAFSLTLPFVEDFFYATTAHYPKTTLWKDSNVYVNTGFAIAPPSIGVATFMD